MPLGGGENTSGYKGFGLSAVVDIFSGILSGECQALCLTFNLFVLDKLNS